MLIKLNFNAKQPFSLTTGIRNSPCADAADMNSAEAITA